MQDQPWGERLRAFRARLQMKQEAVAAELGISQPYLSRIESGAVPPSDALIERLGALLGQRDHRPDFELWRDTVRHAPAYSSLIRQESGAVRAVEFSAGFRALGGVFAEIGSGQSLDGLFAKSTDALFSILVAEGLFEGGVVRTENMWRSGEAPKAPCFKVVNTPVRDDFGAWYVHTSHVPVPGEAFEAWSREHPRPHIVRPDAVRTAQRPYD